VKIPTTAQCDQLFLDDHQTAQVLGISVKTLRNWRFTGKVTLPYRKFGGSVRYSKADVLAWADAQTKHNTSEGVAR